MFFLESILFKLAMPPCQTRAQLTHFDLLRSRGMTDQQQTLLILSYYWISKNSLLQK